MTAALKISFLVVLAFGFLFPSEVDGIIKCYQCSDKPLNSDDECKTSGPCPSSDFTSCNKNTATQDGKGVKAYFCGLATGGKDTCGRNVQREVDECVCFSDLCNSIGRLHGWTFVQLIAISFVVVFVGAGVKP